MTLLLTTLVVVGALALSVLGGWGVSVLVLRWARVPEVILPEYERDATGRLVPILASTPKPSRRRPSTTSCSAGVLRARSASIG